MNSSNILESTNNIIPLSSNLIENTSLFNLNNTINEKEKGRKENLTN